MRLTCIVCRELLVPSDDVSAAPCGHFFHYTCWLGWLERSKTCPQCRKKTTEKQIFRLYFNVAEGEGEEVEDAASIHNKLDSLTFNLRLKEKELSSTKEVLEKEQNTNKGLRDEVKKYRAKVEDAVTHRQCLEEKISYLQQLGKEASTAKAKVVSLESKVGRMQRLEKILQGNVGDVQEILDTTEFTADGFRSLALFCASLKRLLEDAKEKRQLLRKAHEDNSAELRKVRSQLNDAQESLMKAEKAKEHLEGDVKHLENEKTALTRKLHDLEQAILSPSADSARDKALRRFIAESPAPERLKRNRDDETSDDENALTPILTAPGRSFLPSQPSQTSQSSHAQRLDLDGSPFLGVRPLIVKDSGPQRTSCQPLSSNSALGKMSIFNRRLQTNQAPPVRHTSQYGETYDGFGGHSKVDEFPSPHSKPIKKPKVSTTTQPKKKLQAPAGVPKLNQFNGFINLDL